MQFDEYFGFTDSEVKEILRYYGLSSHYDEMKEWYDGYEFGNIEVYCPWDVINYCDTLLADPEAEPRNYWLNTSSNESVKHFLQSSGSRAAKREVEKLVAGEVIMKEIHQELTYKEMYDSVENMWSVLYTTGYLTKRGKAKGDIFNLVIPNMEIRKIFTTKIMELFRESVSANGERLDALCTALKKQNTEEIQRLLSEYLEKTISIRDTFVKKKLKENFYHGILLGILSYQENWSVFSNKESGDGYSDILIETEDGETGIVIELKHAEAGNLEKACQAALDQIRRKRYEARLLEEGIKEESIVKYGIAFYKKICMVKIIDGI